MLVTTRPVYLSLGIFHYWLHRCGDQEALNQYLPTLFNKYSSLQGIEVFCPWNELPTLAQNRSNKKHILTSRFNCLSAHTIATISRSLRLHLPSLSTLSLDYRGQLTDALGILYESGVSTAVVHPDDATREQWEAIITSAPHGMHITVENMDIRKSSFKRLTEVARLLVQYPSLYATFDVCHWVELGRSPVDSELYLFVSMNFPRIDSLHYSAPSSQATPYLLSPDPTECHYMVEGSSWGSLVTIPRLFSETTEIVLEGGVPVHGGHLLERELRALGVRPAECSSSVAAAA
jgi:hypothetical protein